MILIHQEWIFFQCVTSSVGPLFEPPEVVLRVNLLPALLGGRREEVTESLCRRIDLGMKWAGTGIPDPTQTPPTNFDTS